MIHWVILIMMTVMEVKKVKTGLASSPTIAIAIPKTLDKNGTAHFKNVIV
jgi:hypothetical protein